MWALPLLAQFGLFAQIRLSVPFLITIKTILGLVHSGTLCGAVCGPGPGDSRRHSEVTDLSSLEMQISTLRTGQVIRMSGPPAIFLRPIVQRVTYYFPREFLITALQFEPSGREVQSRPMGRCPQEQFLFSVAA